MRRWPRWRRATPRARRFRQRLVRSHAAPQPRPHAGAVDPRRPGERSGDADHQGRDARSRQLDTLEIAYLLEGLPVGEPLHFGVELNFAGLPAGADDRFFRDARDNRLGQLGTRLDLSDISGLGLTDEWLGIDVDLAIDRPSGFWTYPIETVSQSEGGFELVHQSVVVHPHWFVQADAEGRWSVKMTLSIDTSAAESRRRTIEHAVAGV